MSHRLTFVGLTLAITTAAIAAAVLLAGIAYWLMGFSPIGLGQLSILSATVAAVISPFVIAPLLHKSFELKRLVSRLDHLAYTDELTGLPNRRSFFKTARDMFDAARQEHTQLAILMVDIDRFKALNDTHGHEAGDVALKQVAETIAAVLERHAGADHVIGRLGGEEFAIIVRALEETFVHALAQDVCEEMRRTIIHVDAQEFNLTVSIGVAADVAHLSIDTALSLADDAAYEAKDRGRDGWTGATVPSKSARVGPDSSPTEIPTNSEAAA